MSLNNLSSFQNPLLIGKEFLLEDDLFIAGFNPHVSTNRTTVGGNEATNDLYKALTTSHQTTGKLYIFDTTNFREPTKEEFKTILRLEDFYGLNNTSDSPFLGEANKLRITNNQLPYKPILSFPVNISYNYSDPYLTEIEESIESPVYNLQKRIIKVTTKNPLDMTGVLPVFDSTEPFQNTDLYKVGIFCLLVVDTLGTNKVYGDINETTPLTSVKPIYIIPSNNILVTEDQEVLSATNIDDYILTGTNFENLTTEEIQTIIDEDQLLGINNPKFKNIKERLPKKLKILIKSGVSQFDFFANPNYSYMFPNEISTLKMNNILKDSLNKTVEDSSIALYNLNDSNINGFGGRYPISANGFTPSSFVPGKFNKATTFTGDNYFTSVNNVDILSKISGTLNLPQSWSINFWIKPNATQVAGAALISFRTGTNTSFFQIIHPTTDGSIIKFIGGATGGASITLENISTTEWNMITVVNENDPTAPNYSETQNVGNAKVYVNGILKGTGSGFVCDSTNIFNIGKANGAAVGIGYKGLMEQVRIFRKALTEVDINSSGLVNENLTLTQNEKDLTTRKIIPDFINQGEISLTDALGMGGIPIQTHSKVYLYIGRSTATSVSNINTQDQNKSYVADIDQVTGKVSNFTYLGTDPLGQHGLPYVYQDPITKKGWVYSLPSFQFAGAVYTNIIKYAQINEDGTIGTWINSNLTHSEVGYVGNVIAHPDDPSIFYTTWSQNATVTTKKVISWKILPKGTLVKLSETTQTTTGDSANNDMVILKAPIDNTINPNKADYFLYKFGLITTPTNVYKNSIIRYTITNYILSETFEIVGSYGNINVAGLPIKDDLNIYLLGGSGGSSSLYGASDQIVKLPIKDLISCTVDSPKNFEGSLESLLYPVNGYIKETKYGWYIYPTSTTYSAGTSYNWDANIKKVIIIPKIAPGDKTLLLPDLTSINKSNTLNTKVIGLNKLGSRFLQENYNNLFIKSQYLPTDLYAYNKPIMFKDPVNGNILTPIDVTKPRAISKNEKFIIDYLSVLSGEDNLDKYNEYLYIYDKLNTDRLFDIIIQEIIFLILTDRNFININKEVLTWYLNHETLNPVSLGLEIPETFNLDDSLYRLYKFVVDVNINVPVTYSVLGPQILKATKAEIANPTDVIGNIVGNGYILPKNTNIDFGSIETNFDYIFIPQRNDIKRKSSLYMSLNYTGGSSKPSLTSSHFKPKITEESQLPVPVDADGRLWYFISPTGDDTNSGLLPSKPLKTSTNIPANSYIALLPGTYNVMSGVIINSGSAKILECFKGLKVGHKYYGYGSQTILDYTAPTNVRDKPVIGATSLSIEKDVIVSNLVVNWNSSGAGTNNYSLALTLGITVTFDYVTFNLNNSNYANTYSSYATYNNCTFNNGVMIASYNGATYVTNIIKTQKEIVGPNFDSLESNAVNKLKQNYTIKPSYTLIPVNDKDNISGQIEDSQEFNKSVVLDINTNIRNISNTNIKL